MFCWIQYPKLQLDFRVLDYRNVVYFVFAYCQREGGGLFADHI